MYKLPDTLSEDIARLGALAKAYRDGQVETARFKAFRVPMGIYEQRRDEVYMVRVRTTGGVIHPTQFLQLIDIARRHNSDLLHITTRQEIQLQNLALDRVESVLNELRQTGLSSKGGGGNTVRNIMVSAGSGISPGEVFDTTPYAMALTTKLIAEPDSYLLPRKMKIAFSSGDTQTDYAAINDLGFVARIRDGRRGFKVYAGGGCGSRPTTGWTLFEFIPAEEIFVVAAALKTMFSEHGNRKNKHKARLRYIFYRSGEEETLRLIRKYYEEAKTATSLFTPAAAEEETAATPIALPPETALPAGYGEWAKRYVIPQRQTGYSSVILPFVLGNLPLTNAAWVDKIKALLHFVARFGTDTVRFTTTQNIRLRNLPDHALPELYTRITGIIPDFQAPLAVNNIVSCTGADTCRLGITLSKGLANAIRRELMRSFPAGLDKLADARIHISGCPNSCGQQLWADIGFSGKVLRNDRVYPGYQVHLAASRGDQPRLAEAVGSISARDIPGFVARLLASYLEIPEPPSLTAWLESEGEGRKRALELLAGYGEIPSFDEDKNYYFDWGAEEVFSVVNRGAAECSAGLFDMIELDLNHINACRQAIETETDRREINRLLYETVYSSARMLLVTRGAEPKSIAGTFDLFLTLFINSGLVSGEYRDLVETAGTHALSSDFIPRKKEIHALADAVVELYRNMDDSLQFKNVQPLAAVPPSPPPPVADEKQEAVRIFKDLRGVACPMNFVHAKIQLSVMKAGEELEIWLDDGPPIENVPGSVRGEGHRILEQTPVENYWKVIIKKKYEQD
jgi:sulfite reductase (ferredoxin)